MRLGAGMRGERDERRGERDALEMTIHDVRTTPADEGDQSAGYQSVTLGTTRGELALRYYHVVGARRGVALVGGAGGGWDTPGRGQLYPRLCEDLASAGLAAVRVRYRQPNMLAECVLDVLAALHFLECLGVEAAAVVGHSFGGAVALQAAVHAENVRAVVTLSTQGRGADAAGELPPGCAALFVHGTADELLRPTCSQYAFELAREPKRLRLYAGARHGLDEAADEIRAEVRGWVVDHLCGGQPDGSSRGGAVEPAVP